MKLNLEVLTKEEEFVVKWQFRMLGDFHSALAKAIMLADMKNLDRLEMGFPDEVRGYRKFGNVSGWWTEVKRRAGVTWE